MKLPYQPVPERDLTPDMPDILGRLDALERMLQTRVAQFNNFPNVREEPYESGLQTNRIVAPNLALFVQHVNPAPSSSATLDVNGAIATREFDLTLANGANQNVVIGVSGFAHIIGPTAAFNIGGFAGGSPGRILFLFNDVNQTLTINNQDAGSTATNRIRTMTGANLVLRANFTSFVTLIYSGLSVSGGGADGGRWIVVASN